MHLSIVSPVYNAEAILSTLVLEIEQNISPITKDYEIILVDDCSPDNSWEKIELICAENSKVKGIKLSRNFGQHYAITAGLEHITGDWVIVMDCDMQDNPKEIPNLYAIATNGFDIVQATRKNRKDPLLKRFTSYAFYKFLNLFLDFKFDGDTANFGIYSKNVVEAIKSNKNRHRVLSIMMNQVGFKKTKMPVEHNNRMEGSSSYNIKKLFNLGLDIILSNSDRPLMLIVVVGFLISASSFLYAIYNFYKYLNHQILVSGYTSIIISIWFLSGIIIFILGIIGFYIGKIFDSVKNQPIYIVYKKINI
jgi:glycosyltransferase involved in cell wall biosynthesis